MDTDALPTFANDPGPSFTEVLRTMAPHLLPSAGLDTAAFGACLADTTVAGAVMDETSAGRDLGVSSTPTIRIIGRTSRCPAVVMKPMRAPAPAWRASRAW